MTLAARKLKATADALRQALHDGDWEQIGQLDLRCREEVDEALGVQASEAELKKDLESLLGVYRELVLACTAERDRTGEQMLQVQRSHKGAKVYQLFG